MPNLFMIDLFGTEVSPEEKVLLQHPNVGALILFSRNFLHPEQLKQLIASVRDIRPDIFIAVDHEGGFVQRFQRHGFRALPAARVFGETFDIDERAGVQLAEKYGQLMATDLVSMGIDLGLAPVLDVHGVSNVIAKLDRAFHSDPHAIIKLAGAFIRGMHQGGMPSVGKHFPGHGSVSADSHISKPVYSASEEQLKSVDLLPFSHLIRQDLLDSIMPAHVTYPAIDPDYPAGFSKIWLQSILREQLQFNGLILSDCLGMVGADIGNLVTRAHQAIHAGCDMLIVCNQSQAVLREVLQERYERSDASIQRIEEFKKKMIRFTTEASHSPSSLNAFVTEQSEPIFEEQHKNEWNNTRSV